MLIVSFWKFCLATKCGSFSVIQILENYDNMPSNGGLYCLGLDASSALLSRPIAIMHGAPKNEENECDSVI